MHEEIGGIRTLEERVISVVADTLGRDPEEIEPGQSLVGQLGANSIDLVDLGFRLEQAFGIELDANRLMSPLSSAAPTGEGEVTVGRIVELVREAQPTDTPA